MNKLSKIERRILVDRLNRIFPKLEMYIDGEEDGFEFYPPTDINWDDVINQLELNGLEITDIK